MPVFRSNSRASQRSTQGVDPSIELQDASTRDSGAGPRRDSQYDAPDSWANLDEIAATEPISSETMERSSRHPDLEEVRSLQRERSINISRSRRASRGSRHRRRSSADLQENVVEGDEPAQNGAGTSGRERRGSQYDAPESWGNLDELAASEPVLSALEERTSGHLHLEQIRSSQRRRSQSVSRGPATGPTEEEIRPERRRDRLRVSKLATEIYTLSYLIFFAIMGTLARVGTTALTTYPNAPIIFGVLWANFGGSLIMGFLVQDQRLFSYDIKENHHVQQAIAKKTDEENGGTIPSLQAAEAEASKARMAAKKTIPLYIGLATGFCGSYTSFSSFIADAFFALSNNLVSPGGADPPPSRSGGYSFLALLAVILSTVSLSLSGLFLGGHIAVALGGLTPSISSPATRKILDPLAVFLGWGSWLGAILLATFPPHDFWRGRIVFALVFAPLGTLLRFYLAVYLNGKVLSFPLGTFTANVFATAVLGMAWDIAHVPIGGVVGCQVLQGIEDGFCGCLSTISTWVAELTSLRRQHAYTYGVVSVAVSLACLIAIMGGLRWTDGFSSLQCST